MTLLNESCDDNVPTILCLARSHCTERERELFMINLREIKLYKFGDFNHVVLSIFRHGRRIRNNSL